MSKRFGGSVEAQAVDFGALGAAMSGMRGSFAPGGPVSFSPASEPRHFSPANPGLNPTAGWDPFDPMGEGSADLAQAEHNAIEAARAEGFAEGMATAERMAAERGEVDAQALGRIAAALEAMSGFDRDALAGRLRQTVLFLVSRLVGDAGVSAELLGQRIEAAAALLADSVELVTIRLHPEDRALVEGHLPIGAQGVPDPSIERGGFRIETRTSAVQDGPTTWLTQLSAALDRAALDGEG